MFPLCERLSVSSKLKTFYPNTGSREHIQKHVTVNEPLGDRRYDSAAAAVRGCSVRANC